LEGVLSGGVDALKWIDASCGNWVVHPGAGEAPGLGREGEGEVSELELEIGPGRELTTQRDSEDGSERDSRNSEEKIHDRAPFLVMVRGCWKNKVCKSKLEVGFGGEVVAQRDGEDGRQRDGRNGEEKIHESGPFLISCTCTAGK